MDAIQDSSGLEKEVIKLQGMGVQAPFGFGSTQHPHEPTKVIADVAAGGLGLPDRDYYIKTEKRFADAREGYLRLRGQNLHSWPDPRKRTRRQPPRP